jgi:hypothetical protein
MANSVSTRILVDGPRNHIVEVVGVIDTADIAAASVITAGITNLSAVVIYATTTAVVEGQSVSGTGIPVGATVASVQAGVGFTLSAPATATNGAASLTLGGVIVVDPALMGAVAIGQAAVDCNVERIVYSIEPGLDLRLEWEATTPKFIAALTGAGHDEFQDFGGLSNNSGAGKTGRILLITQGWTSGAALAFTLVLECVKK